MSDAGQDIDDAAEPFMEQAREALGDEDTGNAALPPERQGERDGGHPRGSQRSEADRD